MSGTFNFKDLQQAADDAGFSVVPVDTYSVEVATAEAGVTSTGKHQIKVRFKILSGPYAGKSVFNNFVISPDNGNALGFFFRHMKVLGLDRGYFDTNPPLTSVAASIVGRQCLIVVGIRMWNDQEQNEVKSLKPLAGAVIGSAPMMPTPHGLGAPLGMPTTPFPAPPVDAPVPAAMAYQPPAPANHLTVPDGTPPTTVPPHLAPPAVPAYTPIRNNIPQAQPVMTPDGVQDVAVVTDAAPVPVGAAFDAPFPDEPPF